MKVTIREITNKKGLKAFVRFPNQFYKDCKFYVPTLEAGDLDTLDTKKNHAFEFCTGKYWMAFDENGKAVGRIAGIINNNYNEKVGKKIARFGFVDFIDDDSVVDALFDTAEGWARSEGLEIMNGPLGFLEFDASGVLVEGFDELPTAYGKYNFPYYEKQILRRGYEKDTDWVEYRVTLPDKLPEKYAKASKLIAERYNVHIDTLKSKKDLVDCFDEMGDLMNRTYANIHGYSILSKGQIEDLKGQFTMLLKPEFVAVVRDANNKMVAFGVTAPSMSEAMQKCKGKLFPFGFLHILHALNHNDVLDTLLIGVDDDYKSKGVTALIFDAISGAIYKNGIKYIETTRELEDNTSVHNLWNRFEYRLHKRARCYIKNLCVAAAALLAAAGLCSAQTPASPFAAPRSSDIFSINTCPGENVSTQVGVSWSTSTAVPASVLYYTTEADADWSKAIKVLPQENSLCTVFQGVASDKADGSAWKEDAVFTKCGVVLTDLVPDTKYKYIIVEGDAEHGFRSSTVHHFLTAGAKNFSACIISDFHSYTPLPKRLEAAMGMIDTMEGYDPSLDFIFSPGDVVAWGGSYSFWRRLFEEPNFEEHIWARVNGNHDNWTKESQITRNFDIPNDYFKSTSYFPHNGYAGELGVCYHFRYGNTLFLMLNTEDMSKPGEFEAAAEWVRSTVKAARASADAPTFVVACMHYEWFLGTNGRTSQYGRWSPVFDEVGLDLAVAGNNHVYLRTQPLYAGEKTDGKTKGTVYLQTTASDNDRGRSFSEDPMQNPDLIEVRWTEGPHSVSAIHMDVNAKRIKLTLLDRNAKEIDSCIVYAKH